MMRKATQDYICRIRMCNARIRNENHLLRCTLRNISADPYSECSKVLSSVIDHCTKKKCEPISSAADSGCVCCLDQPNCTTPRRKPSSCSLPSSCRVRFTPPPTQRKCPNPCCVCCEVPCSTTPVKKINLSPKFDCRKPSALRSRPNALNPKPNALRSRSQPRSGSPCSSSGRSQSSSSYRRESNCSPRPQSASNAYKSNFLSTQPTCKFKPKKPTPCCCFNCKPCSPKMPSRRDFCSNNENFGKTSNPNKCKEPSLHETKKEEENRPSCKILGELAFQLERRILDYVFGVEGFRRRRFYGYTVSNICSMMGKECKNICGTDDQIKKSELAYRLKKLLVGLSRLGYDITVHGDFAQKMINTYGLLPCPPDRNTIRQFGLHSPDCISCLISKLAVSSEDKKNLDILLSSLQYLSQCDGRPLFVW